MTYIRQKRQLRRQERKDLTRRVWQMRARVDKILQEAFDKRIFRLSETDGYRLLVFGVWAQKYKVSLDFIVRILVSFYLKHLGRHINVRKKSLGIRISTLTGDKAEQLLRETIQREFPNFENVGLWRQRKKESILSSREGDDTGLTTKVKTILDYPTPEAYVRAYRRKINQAKKDDERADNDQNKKRPYRGNPWL